MRRFEKADVVADVRAGRDPQPADLGGAGVRQVVAVEVRTGEHIVVGRSRQDLLEHAVGDAVVDEDLAFARRAAPHLLFGHDVIAELGLATSYPQSRNAPSVNFMMFPLWTRVSVFRLLSTAY